MKSSSESSGHCSVVLLVEDQKDDIDLIRRAFQVLNLHLPLQVVTDGDQAIEYLEGVGKFANRAEYPLPAIVLLDLKMPRKDGFEVLKWIREQPGLNALRVIVLTSSELREDVNYAYQLGANSFMVKPVEFRQLVAEVEVLAQYWLVTAEAPDASRATPARRPVR